MKKKQAEPNAEMAQTMGVSSYIPKNVSREETEQCEWEDRYQDYDGTWEVAECRKSATHEVTTSDGVTLLCESHSDDAQVEFAGPLSVRRRRLV